MANHHELANLIRQITDLLRGHYQGIRFLKERRAALIAAAVTGRVSQVHQHQEAPC